MDEHNGEPTATLFNHESIPAQLRGSVVTALTTGQDRQARDPPGLHALRGGRRQAQTDPLRRHSSAAMVNRLCGSWSAIPGLPAIAESVTAGSTPAA
jgi:hypothetical protein